MKRMIGFVMVMVGVAFGDSDCLLIPLIAIGIGAWLLLNSMEGEY